jgi:4-carboxymuconolactone decarboxylase
MITCHSRKRRPGFLAVVLILVLMPWMNVSAQDRMQPIPADKMTDAQKKVVAEYAAARATTLSGGPFMVLLRIPEVMNLARLMREHVQFRTVLGQKLTELAILITAREWTQQYEWNAHHQAAIKAGLKPDLIKAIAEGRRPDHMAEDEAVLYDFCVELHRNQSVSDATYARALSKFGEEGIVEAATIEGFYTLLAMVMNTARTSLPPGATPALGPFPR